MRLSTLIRDIIIIRNRERIPPLPRGMLAGSYEPDALDADARRVLARLGSRDVRGISKALKRARAHTVDELIDALPPFEAERRIGYKLRRALERFAGGSATPPHANETRRAIDALGEHREIVERVLSFRDEVKK